MDEKVSFANLSPPSPAGTPPSPAHLPMQLAVVWQFANGLVDNSMWGKRADGMGVVLLLGALGCALTGKAGPVEEYADTNRLQGVS